MKQQFRTDKKIVENMKLGILTTAYGRPQISKLYHLQNCRLKKSFEFIHLVVVSTDEDEELFRGWGFETLRYPNQPLGRKFQAGLDALRGRIDKMMLMGSDDLISDGLFRRLVESERDVVWPDSLYFLGTMKDYKGLMRFHRGIYNKLASVGMVITSRLLDKMDWQLWGDQLRGIDHASYGRIMSHEPDYEILPTLPDVLIDVKSDVNINHLKKFLTYGERVREDVLVKLSPEEQEYIKELCQP